MRLTWKWKLHVPPKRWYPPVTTVLCSKPKVNIIYDLNILFTVVRYEGDIWLFRSFALSFQVGAAERCRIAFVKLRLFPFMEIRRRFNLNIPAQSNVWMEACDTRNISCNSVNICGSGLLYLCVYQHSVEDCSLSAVYLWQWSVIPTQCWRLFIVWSIFVTVIHYTNTVFLTVHFLKYIRDSDSL
jgi:hypothetical protein